MLPEDRFFRDFTEDELWQRYCGFLDLSLDRFMDIQKELLLDQIERIAPSVMGKKIMGNQVPGNVDEFRRTVPLTTYQDYEPYLSEKKEDVLAEKPRLWCHSSGRGGYFKWIPHSVEFMERVVRNLIGCFILAMTNSKGKVNLQPGFRILSIIPPRPYASGWLVYSLSERITCKVIPPILEAESMDFEERVQKAMQIALREGADVAAATSSILVKMGELFTEEAGGTRLSMKVMHPKIVMRLLRASLKARSKKRTLLPGDLWPVKGIVSSGMDSNIYSGEIAHYWGHQPYQFYSSSDAGFIAMQAWNKKMMTFLPDSVFLEFIPQSEQACPEGSEDYQPETLLMNEVEEGKLYEVVITQLYGMPLLRYRTKDLIKINAMEDKETGVKLPQMTFQRRIGETINLASLAELDEKTIWRAIADTGMEYNDWTACKEYDGDKAYVRLYLELKKPKDAEEVASQIDKKLKIVDPDYRDIDSYLGLQPVKVTILSPGTFEKYTNEKRREGRDLAHLKPRHINPPQPDVEQLIHFNEVENKKW
ncbi:MAG: GH3 auxin-responsive promoter family protein [Dehalococcoidales bacterium]